MSRGERCATCGDVHDDDADRGPHYIDLAKEIMQVGGLRGVMLIVADDVGSFTAASLSGVLFDAQTARGLFDALDLTRRKLEEACRQRGVVPAEGHTVEVDMRRARAATQN